jgi:hypothetical protein
VELSLQSDFRDWYDIAFKPSGLPDTLMLKRMTRSGMSRPRMLEYLDEIGYRPPRYGSVTAMYAELMRNYEGGGVEMGKLRREIAGRTKVVLHHDLLAHSGESKYLTTLQNALDYYPSAFAVEYIPSQSRSEYSRTLRFLHLGELSFVIEYSSRDWRSNVNGSARLVASVLDEPHFHTQLPFPIHAVDFIETFDGLRAIDLNIAPGTDGLGLEKVVSREDVYESIKRAAAFAKEIGGDMVAEVLPNLRG